MRDSIQTDLRLCKQSLDNRYPGSVGMQSELRDDLLIDGDNGI